MYYVHLFGLLTIISTASSRNYIPYLLVKDVDESGARILQEAVRSGELSNNKSSLATTLEEKYKDDKYLQHYGRMEIGTPPQKFNVSFNPATSLTMIASNKYKRNCAGRFRSFDEQSSHSYREVGESVAKNNGTLAVKIVKETFHLSKHHIVDQFFGLVINGTCEDSLYDGVIGLGFSTNYLTLLDNLVKQQSISFSIAGLYLDRNFKTRRGGELALGYWNPRYCDNPDTVEYIPIENKLNPSWIIRLKMAFIGDQQLTFDRSAIIDLSSFFIDIPYFEAQQFARQIGAHNFKGNLIVDCKRVNKLPKFIVTIQNSNYTLEGKDYVDTVNSYQGHCVVLIRSSDENVWTLGGAFLGKFYTIFHYETKKVAFATLIPPKNDGSRIYSTVWYTSPLILLTLLMQFLR